MQTLVVSSEPLWTSVSKWVFIWKLCKCEVCKWQYKCITPAHTLDVWWHSLGVPSFLSRTGESTTKQVVAELCLGCSLLAAWPERSSYCGRPKLPTMNHLSAICFSVLLHITTAHNILHPPTEERTLFPHQTKILMLKEGTESKHFISPELAFFALTVISESLIICMGQCIWVEPKPTL